MSNKIPFTMYVTRKATNSSDYEASYWTIRDGVSYELTFSEPDDIASEAVTFEVDTVHRASIVEQTIDSIRVEQAKMNARMESRINDLLAISYDNA
jgi:hypothetical protein